METSKRPDSPKKSCIIHHAESNESDDHLIKPLNYSSWLSLLEAAKVRKHAPILDIGNKLNDNEVPTLYYHRKCRSIFTMKRDLDSLKRKADDSLSSLVGSGGSNSIKLARRSSSEARVYEAKCVFCNKVKFQKRSKSREKLTQAVQLRADQRLRECAIQKGDANIIAATSRDIVAAEAHYHVSCYKNYTRSQIKETEAKGKYEQGNEVGDYERMEGDAFEKLFLLIRNEIIPKREIVTVLSLTSKLESFMLTGGVEVLKDSTRKHIRRQLESELADSVAIFPDDNGKLLMVPDTVSLPDVVIENRRLQRELNLWTAKTTNFNKFIDQTSSQIRLGVKQNIKTTPWPYHPSDVAGFSIPTQLERFLVGLLTGDPDRKILSDRVSALVQSFSQDIVYAVTCGQCKPPKHILLPYAVKTLTGSTEVIRTLNRLGHGVSYSQLEENDTALCLQKLAAGLNQKVVLPESIKPYVFTNIAWDNIDRLEETLTGKGTSHRVNGIAVQPKVFGPFPLKSERPVIAKQKQRSVDNEIQELDVYVAGTRVGPKSLPTKQTWVQHSEESAAVACKKNLAWILARQVDQERQMIPGWTGFNIRSRDQVPISEDVIGYLPTINAPATELPTVFEILNQSEAIRQELRLETVVVVMDQALFAKAAEIAWKHRDRFSHIILRLGAFHIICNALGIIGKRFRDAGLKDICIESGIVAEGSINGVLDGKHYNRAVRVHKYVYEALMRLAWKAFLIWIEEGPQDICALMESFSKEINDLAIDLNQENFRKMLKSRTFTQVMPLWKQFLDHLRHNNGELSAFWMSYIDMVEEIVLGLLRATREGNWDLHLSAIRNMIPWCFAYDKVNYARYLSPYFAQMASLQEENPAVYDAFKAGHFSVQMSSSNTFGRIPVDQCTEVTVNKDTQTPGGTARFSLNAGAVKRYYITAEHRSAFLGKLRDMVKCNMSELKHADLQEPRLKKDEEAVSAVVSLVQGWVNPFDQEQGLLSISTAKAVPDDIAADLMKAKDIGERCYAAFKDERLEKDPPSKKFHDPLKTNKLKTFSNMCKKKEVTSRGRTIILKADRSLFGRIIVMAQGRNLQMEDILSHPLGPLPWALSTPDGFMRKTNKATLATTLQKNVAVVEQLPENSASLVDGMNLVQKVKGDQVTFGDVANTVFAMALREGSRSNRIDVVFDTYRENSIKNSERLLRGEQSGFQLQRITESQIVRQWRGFLSQVSNKSSLIAFIVSHWQKRECRSKLQDKVLYVNAEDRCYKITDQGSDEVPDLQCQQEEADGRLLLHAAHAAKDGYQAVVICSEDTDVFIMAMSVQDRIGVPMFQKCGSRARTRVVDIGKVAASLGLCVCKALIGMHAYTGCDTVSAFAGKGKASALKLLKTHMEIQDTFLQLGQEWDLSEELMDNLETFTCLLYAPKASSCMKVNRLRYHLFCARKGEIESHQLPPCKDCLLQHAQRANYQAAIWRRCLEQDPQTPSPVGRGWKIENEAGERLVVHWMDGQPAPEAVLDLLACDCARKCELPKCACLASGLKCTDMCRLPNCANQNSLSDSEGGTDDDDNGTDDDDNDF